MNAINALHLKEPYEKTLYKAKLYENFLFDNINYHLLSAISELDLIHTAFYKVLINLERSRLFRKNRRIETAPILFYIFDLERPYWELIYWEHHLTGSIISILFLHVWRQCHKFIYNKFITIVDKIFIDFSLSWYSFPLPEAAEIEAEHHYLLTVFIFFQKVDQFWSSQVLSKM